MRIGSVAVAVSLALVGIVHAQHVAAAIRVPTGIPAQPLRPALQKFSTDRGLQLIYRTDVVGSLTTPGANGDLTIDEALQRLLAGTGLTYRYLDVKTITVLPVGSAATDATGKVEMSGGDTVAASPSALDVGGNGENSQGEKDNSLWERFRLAQLDQGPRANAALAGASSSSDEPVRLEEIIVTAQKREERQQDVPVAMTVLNPQTLADNGQNRLVDYFASVPGLNISGSTAGGGTNYITVRGLSAGANQNPLVAIVIDDVPTTASNARAGGQNTSPDLDPSDLARIEVLKGPQGTFYGADSLSGLIKYVTVDPSTNAFSGRAEVAGVETVGGGLGYAVRGAVNIPVSDTFAIRASAFSRRDPGYIDDLTTGQKNFNSTDVYGGHVAALLKPSDNLSVKLSALFQEADGGGSYFDSNFSGQSSFGSRLGLTILPGTTPYRTQDQLYSATVDWKVAGVDITSVTGYVVNTLKNWTDFSLLFGGIACADFPASCLPASSPSASGGSSLLNYVTTDKVSEELRVGSSIGNWLDWRLGGFFTHENAPVFQQSFYAANLTTGAIVGKIYGADDFLQTFREYAIFGDLTAHITDRFDVQFGGRQSWSRQEDHIVDTGASEQAFDKEPTPPPNVFPPLQADGSAFTFLVTPEFKILPDLMTYARLSSGYRLGGYNVTSVIPGNIGLGVPSTYAPDKTTNYEFGIKGYLFDHKLSFDASAYYIQWKNFQVNITSLFAGAPDNITYTANAGNAKSEGLELSLEAHPLQGLTITAEGSYDNAVLTQNVPCCSVYGLAGDRLPYSMRFSGGFTMNQDILLSSDWMGFVGGSLNYVGSRPYEFTGGATSPRQIFPAYTKLNLRTGVRYQSWLINLYLNNVTDTRGVVGNTPSYSLNSPAGYNATIIQPRTIGLSINKTW